MIDLWDVATDIKEGSSIRVKYDSSRGDGFKTMTGEVIKVDAYNGLIIRFQRSDGQKCDIEEDGSLYSFGSDHPYTGEVVEAEVINGDVAIPPIKN